MAQNILVIDDEKAIRKALNEILTFEGFTVDEAADGAEGARKIKENSYDCILCDIKMPKMDGMELLHHCQSLPESHRPRRVIAISGEYEASVLHGQAAQVQFLAKPFTIDHLLDLLGGKPN